MVSFSSRRRFPFCEHTSTYEVILALLPTYQKTVVTADITPRALHGRKSLKQQLALKQQIASAYAQM